MTEPRASAYASIRAARRLVEEGAITVLELAERTKTPASTIRIMLRNGYENRTLSAADRIAREVAAIERKQDRAAARAAAAPVQKRRAKSGV